MVLAAAKKPMLGANVAATKLAEWELTTRSFLCDAIAITPIDTAAAVTTSAAPASMRGDG